ncbi:MAG: ribonuclease R [Clostridia bacterium]|nr:ribonuclease R [Clostridia bacterium]
MSNKVKDKILELINDELYIPLTPPDLYALMGEDNYDVGDFFDTLCRMEQNMDICVTKSGKISSPEKNGYIRGIFSASARGRFGFTVTEKGDFFIPPKFTLTAMDGDEVLIRKFGTGSRYYGNGNEAEVCAITKRNTVTFVGTFHGYTRAGRMIGEVHADSERLDICASVSGLDKSGASDGDKVVVKITKYPRYDGDSIHGKITDVLGKSDTLEANYLSILHENSIVTEFDTGVLEDADRIANEEIKPDGRLDLRCKNIFTIDSESAKDLDDAISIEKTEDGYILGVHIADVSHYVREKTLVDKEAMARGTSVYFTDKVVPMLPRVLSNGVCSLNGGEDRYAMSAFMTLDKNGEIISTSVHSSIINSKVRGVYSELNDILKNRADSPFYEKYSHIIEDFYLMMELYSILKRKSIQEGAMDLESDESEIILDKNGHPVSIIKRERGETEKLIEQFMLCANRGVAEFLTAMEMPCVYRIHESPDTEKTDAFLNFALNMGIDVSCARMGRTPSPKQLSQILDNAKELGKADVVSSVLLRSLKKAKYSAQPKIHYGLATELYCHFTSPIRRYPDLTVHRILKSVLGGAIDGEKVSRLAKFAERSAQISSENELRALYAERGIDDLYKAVYMADRLGMETEGVICSVTSFGFFVRTDDMCEGLVPISSLNGEFFFDENAYSLISRDRIFKLGQRARVRIFEADIISRKITFELISCEESEIPKTKYASMGKSPAQRSESKGKHFPSDRQRRNDKRTDSSSKRRHSTKFFSKKGKRCR